MCPGLSLLQLLIAPLNLRRVKACCSWIEGDARLAWVACVRVAWAVLAGGVATVSAQVFTLTTAAGSGYIGDGGAAREAILRQPQGLASDWDGNLFIAEAGGHRVRKISRTGEITTVAGTGVKGFSGDDGPATEAQLDTPYGLAVDTQNRLYIADLGNTRVRRVTPDGIITTVAGGGTLIPGKENEGKPATEFALSLPRNLAPDRFGDGLYVSDFSAHRIYHIAGDGTLTTVAGTGECGYSGNNGAPSEARVCYPTGIFADYSGNLYISDSQNGVVRKIENGVITDVAHVTTPTGLAFDVWGDLVVADAATGTLRKFPRRGDPSSINLGASDVALGFGGSLFVTDSNAGIVHEITYEGKSSLAAGPGPASQGDDGPATLAILDEPRGVAADASGNIYVADRASHRIRRVAADGTITTIAGTGVKGDAGDGRLATEALLDHPVAVALDAAGNLYIGDTGSHRVRVITPSGLILPVAGTGTRGSGDDGGPAVLAPLDAPSGIAIDQAGNVYIAETDAGKIRRVDTLGMITTVLQDLKGPHSLALDWDGNLYFTEQDGARVGRLDSVTGAVTYLGGDAWKIPRGIAITSGGETYVADTGRQQILRILRNGKTTPVAGTGAAGLSGDGVPALQASLGYPWNVAAGAGGELLFIEAENRRVRRLTSGPAAPDGLQVLNAASARKSPVAPNMLVALRDTGLQAEDVTDTFVLFNSMLVRILSMDDTEIVVQAPSSLPSAGGVEIAVVYQGMIAVSLSADAAAAAPGFFADSAGQASAQNSDGSLNSASRPAARGSVLSLFGTGLGLGDLPVSVMVGGVPAEVIQTSALGAFPGVFQADVRVPQNVMAGSVEVVITVGDAASPAGVSVAVN
jgi:uncharacterized protein (TIGR03437 family)